MTRRNGLWILILTAWLGGGVVCHLGSLEALAQEPAPQQSLWKDRAEYDAFNAMVQAKEPNQQIELADKYLAAYPETKFADKVYEFKLQAYQQLNDSPKMEEAAKKLLEVSPNNFRALLLLSYLIPRTLNAQDQAMDQKLDAAAGYAQKGLEQLAALQIPPGMSPEDFQKQKDQSGAVFHQTAGFVALQKKDYAQAEQALRKSAETNANDALGFYWLGLSYLSPKPPNYDQGVWALARAVSITGAAALPGPTQTQVKKYLTDVYEARHGSTDGLDDVLGKAASSPFPPAEFHIASVEELQPEPEPEPPPPARELTVKAEELSSFDVIQKYLQSGGDKEADTWTLLKGASLPLPGKVVSATPTARPQTIRLAVSPELAAQEGKYDVELTLAAPLPRPIEKGKTIQFEGTADSYTSKPFLLRFIGGKITP